MLPPNSVRYSTIALLVAWLALAAVTATPVCGEDGAAVFGAWCARCHGDHGESNTPDARALKVAPLVNDARLRWMTAAEIATLVKSNAKHRALASWTTAMWTPQRHS